MFGAAGLSDIVSLLVGLLSAAANLATADVAAVALSLCSGLRHEALHLQ